MAQSKGYWEQYKKRPGVAEKNREKATRWRLNKVSTPAGRAEFNAAQSARKKRRIRNPEQWPARAVENARERAKARGLPFNLTTADIIIPAVCPVLGTPFVFGAGYSDTRSPSIDRIKPELGYVRGNVRVISLRANSLRNDATADELVKVALDAVRLEQRP